MAYYEGFGFFAHGRAVPDETAPRQLMVYDILAAIKEAAGAPIAPLARVPAQPSHKADHKD